MAGEQGSGHTFHVTSHDHSGGISAAIVNVLRVGRADARGRGPRGPAERLIQGEMLYVRPDA